MKTRIYGLIAAILHLGNIVFIDEDGKAVVSENSKNSINYATELLSIDIETLQSHFLNRSIKVRESKIR